MLPESPSAQSSPAPLRSLDPSHIQPKSDVPSPFGTHPKPLTSLIGRDDEVATVRALLVEGGVRLLTLTGPGGVGKTRLALRVAEEVASAFPGGVVFVPLGSVNDPDLVLPTIARELGLREDAARSAAERLAAFLAGRRLLLVLDNFEQVRPAATELAAVLADCPGVVALVTSRVVLHVAGERRFPVAPLALPASIAAGADGTPESSLATTAASAAVQLFVDRAQAVDPRFVLDAANAEAVVDICRRLDGLPLAIELAAAWIRVLPPDALLARLERRLPLLYGGADDQPVRLRTMRDAIAWSYDLLTADEARLFRHLAVFVGGFTLEAAEAVASRDERQLPVSSDLRPPTPDSRPPTSDTVLDLVASLIDKSLLQVQRTETDGAARFAMLETIREFGLEQLEESGEAEAIAARHAAWCVRLAEEIRRSGRLSHRDGLAALEAEHPNLRAALSWFLDRGDVPGAPHLSGELAEFWFRHGHVAEGQSWLERVLAADDGTPTAARANALVGLNMLLWSRDEFARATELLDEAEAAARGAGDAGVLAYVRLHQGYVATAAGKMDLAVARGEEALTTCEAIPQQFSCHGALWLLARATLAQGDDNRASELYERLLASARSAGDDISVANGFVGRAIIAERRGDPDGALAGFAEAATVCRECGDLLFAAHCLNAAAVTAVALGRSEPAVRLYAVVETLSGSVGAVMGPGIHLDRERRDQALAAARASLGEGRFAAEWDAGAALTLDEAIAEVAALAGQVSPPLLSTTSAPGALTAREREVLRLLVDGLTDKEIAVSLGIGQRTVSNHVAMIRDKLAAPTRTAAVAIAMRDNLV